MGTPGLAFCLCLSALAGVLQIGATMLGIGTSRMGKRRFGGVVADDSSSGNCALHHGPVSEHAVVFHGGGGLDCAGHCATEVCAGGELARFDGIDSSPY